MPFLIGRNVATGQCLEVEMHGDFVAATRDVQSDTDCWIAPGFVDLQVNGLRGIDLNREDVTAYHVLQLTQLLYALGTTTYLPTIITASHTSMLASLRILAAARSAYPEVQHAVPAIHLEGPHISPIDGYRGAHPAADVRAPSVTEFEELQGAAGGVVRLVTLSPHWPESARFIRALTDRGVVVALGHTHALPEQVREAVEAGATLSTHLGNGIASHLPRHPNPIWTQLANDRLMATFIADGAHLPPEALRVMLRAKGIERSILISDSVALTGALPGEYRSHVGGAVEVHGDGTIRMRGSDLLAGSGVALKDAVARTPGLSGCTLAEAVQMATQNPATALGLPVGSLAVGSLANLVLFRWTKSSSTIDMVDVLVRGQSVRAGALFKGEIE